jgi:alpha-N-acetylglucosamine transferase
MMPTSAEARDGMAIVTAYHHNSSTWYMKHWYVSDPFRSYLNSMRLLFRLVLSLKRVKTQLPMHVLVSGDRHAPFEEWLTRQGVRLIPSNFQLVKPRDTHVASASDLSIRLPAWVNRHFRGTFAKFQALSLIQFRQIVVLDADVVALHNIDHLAHAPAPSFAFRWDCHHPSAYEQKPTQAWEMNSGVMVLRPSRSQHKRLIALLNDPLRSKRLALMSDPSDQSV